MGPRDEELLTPEHPGPRRSRRRRLVQRAMSLLFVAGLLALAIRRRDMLVDAAGRATDLPPGPLILAFLVLLVGRGALALWAWIELSSRLARIDPGPATLVWLRAAAAKYLPGGIWHPLSAIGRLEGRGADLGAAALVLVTDLTAMLVAALVVGAMAIPALITAAGGTSLWLLLAVPALLLVHPRVFGIALRVLERATGRSIDRTPLPPSVALRAVALHGVGWVLGGVSLFLVLRALGAPAPVSLSIPAAPLAWAVGFLFVPAPGGLGVREGALVALLGTSVSAEAALGAALISRAMFIVKDVGGVALSFAIRQGNRGRDT